MFTPSRSNVNALKSTWAENPVWPLEDTVGFHIYYEELLAFRQNYERQREMKMHLAIKKRREYL